MTTAFVIEVPSFDDLAALPLWVAWDAKRGKVPIDPTTGRPARSNDPKTWGTRAEAEACRVAAGLAGVGINLAEVGGGLALAGIDLDTCRDPTTGALAHWAIEIVERFGSYAEISPSETGAKVFFLLRTEDRATLLAEIGDGECEGRKWAAKTGGNHPPAIELYLGRRYFTVTGQHLAGLLKEPRLVDAATVQWLVGEAGPAFTARFTTASGNEPPRDNSRSAVAFRGGLALVRRGASYDEMVSALRADPETVEWCAEKGERAGARELRRIFEKAERIVAEPPWIIDPTAPYAAARAFRKLRHDTDDAPMLFHYRGAFYAWSGAAYPELPDSDIRADVYRFLDQCVVPKCRKDGQWEQVPVKPNMTLVNNVVDGLRAVASLPAAVKPPAWLGAAGPDPAEIIACANGLLHLPMARLLPHTPTFFTNNALDFAYDPAAPAPETWLRFLGQLWEDDPQAIETLQEIFGYCLTPDTLQQKMFLVVGPKRSGKGTIARVLRRLVGEDNAAGPTLAGLGTNFGLEALIGKRVAIVSDARLGGRADQAMITERLLSISGEDTLTIDRKYREAWTGRLGVRFVLLTNELPQLADASGALASRFIVLVMTESFYGREDPGLTDRLLKELPGILNWAIEGWRRLRERGAFVQPASSEEALAELEELGSPIDAFLREHCEKEPGRTVMAANLFSAWESWCIEQRREKQVGNRQTFGRNLRAAFPGVRTRQQHNHERFYEGIGLKVEGELPLDLPPF
jgi:putative DNA primase/helicase